MLERGVERGRDVGIDAVRHVVRQHAEPHAFERPGGRHVRFEAREHPVDERAAGDRQADRAERVERRRQRHAALRRDPARGRRSRSARTARPECGSSRPCRCRARRRPSVGDGRGRAGRRTAGNPRVARHVAVVRRARMAEVRIQPGPENANSLMLVRPTSTAPARLAARPRPRRCARPARRRARANPRASPDPRRRTGLDRHRDARERRQHGARGAQPVVRVGGRARVVGIDFGEDDRACPTDRRSGRARCRRARGSWSGRRRGRRRAGRAEGRA